MTVREALEAEIAKAKALIPKLEAELAALPAEIHALEHSLWEKIKAFFHPAA